MYNRISIIGGSGSGKSTLSTILSKELGLPAVHLDAINFNPNWKEIDKQERDKIIAEKAKEEKWIIDGNYNKTLKERLERADLIIWLDYSTLKLLSGILKRYFHSKHSERPEIPGCKERLDASFVKYVLTYNKKKRHILLEFLQDIPDEKVLIFKHQKDLNAWLKAFTNNPNILAEIK